MVLLGDTFKELADSVAARDNRGAGSAETRKTVMAEMGLLNAAMIRHVLVALNHLSDAVAEALDRMAKSKQTGANWKRNGSNTEATWKQNGCNTEANWKQHGSRMATQRKQNGSRMEATWKQHAHKKKTK